MRRTLVFSALLMAAAAAGCGGNNAPNANSPGTTTYSNTAPSAGESAPAGSSQSGANSNRPQEPGIKPPTDK